MRSRTLVVARTPRMELMKKLRGRAKARLSMSYTSPRTSMGPDMSLLFSIVDMPQIDWKGYHGGG
jgi:hypothetical protein